MEENARRDAERPEDSGEESNRAILPLLQPPGNQQSHRITNFYIDNILRPDFGRKRKNGSLVGDSLGVIIRREELTGRKSSKTGNPQQGGAGGREDGEEEDEERDTGASDEQHPEARGAELRAGEVAGKGRGGGGERCRSPQASAAPAAKPMLWPAWVYCTRYSDRPSS
ncbi:homeobox protein engrailed-2b-like, partial [Plectropomus leopardus]|uniref:homeobox protein engrailed-2b-like n=1 Tax=Plectropomus leopardus TaxID=160734 RepID=UPI001C4C7DEB